MTFLFRLPDAGRWLKEEPRLGARISCHRFVIPVQRRVIPRVVYAQRGIFHVVVNIRVPFLRSEIVPMGQ